MLGDKDRIFTNLYGFQPWNLDAAQARGDWDDTKSLLDIGQDTIIDRMLKEAVRTLKEPNSAYLDTTRANAHKQYYAGKFSGIGVEGAPHPLGMRLEFVYPDSSAKRADLRENVMRNQAGIYFCRRIGITQLNIQFRNRILPRSGNGLVRIDNHGFHSHRAFDCRQRQEHHAG